MSVILFYFVPCRPLSPAVIMSLELTHKKELQSAGPSYIIQLMSPRGCARGALIVMGVRPDPSS